MTFHQFMASAISFLGVFILFCMLLAAFPSHAANQCAHSLDDLIQFLEKSKTNPRYGKYWMNLSNSEHEITVVHVVWEKYEYGLGVVFKNGCRQWWHSQLNGDIVLEKFGLPPRKEHFADVI